MFEIAGSIGTLIRIDLATLNKSIGLYARVLIEVDLASNPPIEILVERVNGDSLLIGLEYEKFHNICSGCGSIGHLLQNCRISHDEPEQAKMHGRSRSRHHQKKSRVKSRYVPKDKPSLSDEQQLGDIEKENPSMFHVVNKGKGLIVDSTPLMLPDPREGPSFTQSTPLCDESLGFERHQLESCQSPVLAQIEQLVGVDSPAASNTVPYSVQHEVDMVAAQSWSGEEDGFTPVVAKKNKK